MTTEKQHVYLVDDDEAVRSAFRLLLETVGLNVLTFSEPTSFLHHLSQLSPGCIVLDIRMPTISGLKIQEQLTDLACDWPVVIVSGHGDVEACRRAFKNGAIDFLSKPVDDQDLIDAIQRGHQRLARAQAEDAEKHETTMLLEKLTPREREVLELICKGFVTKQIADSLSLSPRTVETHRASVASKLGTTSPVEMVQMLIQSGSAP